MTELTPELLAESHDAAARVLRGQKPSEADKMDYAKGFNDAVLAMEALMNDRLSRAAYSPDYAIRYLRDLLRKKIEAKTGGY